MPLHVGPLRLSDDPLNAFLAEPALLVLPVFEEEPQTSTTPGEKGSQPSFLVRKDLHEIIEQASLEDALKQEGFTGDFGSSPYLPMLPGAPISLLFAQPESSCAERCLF